MQQGVDLVAKGMWPIGVFTPYIKAGGQWINRGSLNFENFILNDASILNLQTNTFAFIAGLGVDVEVFTNFKIGLGYTRTFGDSAGNTRPIDFVSLGITYRFNTPEPGEYPYDRRPNRKY
jgi:opacity protein-like surface antigen